MATSGHKPWLVKTSSLGVSDSPCSLFLEFEMSRVSQHVHFASASAEGSSRSLPEFWLQHRSVDHLDERGSRAYKIPRPCTQPQRRMLADRTALQDCAYSGGLSPESVIPGHRCRTFHLIRISLPGIDCNRDLKSTIQCPLVQSLLHASTLIHAYLPAFLLSHTPFNIERNEARTS
jgi:hypothetical protein